MKNPLVSMLGFLAGVFLIAVIGLLINAHGDSVRQLAEFKCRTDQGVWMNGACWAPEMLAADPKAIEFIRKSAADGNPGARLTLAEIDRRTIVGSRK